jgi:ABC-type branched-subunit amino acid transport system substrate-binding protein
VYFSGPAPTARTLVADLIGDGYQGVVMIASDLAPTVLAPLGSTADGVYVMSPADAPAAIAAGGGAGLVFTDAYRAAFGTEPPVWAAEAYDATNIVLAAVASGATTGPAVADYLYNHSWPGVTRRLTFNSSGDQIDPPVFVSRINNGVAEQIAVVGVPAR